MNIEEEIEAYNQKVYGGAMPAHSKALLRSLLEKETEFFQKEARDYSPADEGGEMEKRLNEF